MSANCSTAFPDDIEWHRVALSPDEALGIQYIDWDWWLRISDGTRSPVVAARRIRAGLVPGATADSDSERIARRLQSDDPPPELIAVASPTGPMVLVEGHVRLTSYALFPQSFHQGSRSCSASPSGSPIGGPTDAGKQGSG